MTDAWGETPQEAILDHIYESVVGSEDWTPDLWGVRPGKPLAQLYITDPDGNCWEIKAERHHHG